MAVYSFPIVTGLTAAALGLLYVFLTLPIYSARVRHKVMLGSGGHSDLEAHVRAHGNLAENAPLFLILLLLVELTGHHVLTVTVIGPAFVVLRIVQAIGLSPGRAGRPNLFRGLGALGTTLCEAILAVELGLTLLPLIGKW